MMRWPGMRATCPSHPRLACQWTHTKTHGAPFATWGSFAFGRFHNQPALCKQGRPLSRVETPVDPEARLRARYKAARSAALPVLSERIGALPRPRHGAMARHLSLLLLASLLALGRTEESVGNYLVSVPAELNPLSSEAVCFSLLSVTGDVVVGASLYYGADPGPQLNFTKHTVVVEDTVLHPSPHGDAHKCFDFKVPNIKETRVVELVVTGHGSGLSFSRKHKLIARKLGNIVFIQSDKPIYKPGQSVKFRVVTLDVNFATVLQTYDLIYIEDSKRNRIDQWRNVSGQGGIVQLSIQIQSEPPQGTYTIVASHGEEEARHYFTVEEYVLPTFEVSIQMPPYLTYLGDIFKLRVCGRYTYGKPVHGLMNVSACTSGQPGYWWRKDCIPSRCQRIYAAVGDDGCLDWQLENPKPPNETCQARQVLKVAASLEEEGTGLKMKSKAELMFQKEIFKISFLDVVSRLRPGLPIQGKVKVEFPDGKPVPDKLLELSLRQDHENSSKTQLRTGADGIARFSVETDTFDIKTVLMEVKDPEFNSSANPAVSYDQAHTTLEALFSPSGSFLQLGQLSEPLACGSSVGLDLQLLLKKNDSDAEAGEPATLDALVNVLVMSRGNIRHTETFKLDDMVLGKPRSHLLKVEIRSEFTPSARVLVWTIFNNETVADTVTLTVHKCFPNEVSVGFPSDQEAPGARIALSIRAAPGSLCGVRVVDKSVTLLRPEVQLSANTIFSGMAHLDLSYYDHQIQVPSCYVVSADGPYMPWGHRSRNNVYDLFQGMGLVVMTDTTVREWLPCIAYGYRGWYRELVVAYSEPMVDTVAMAAAPGGAANTAEVEKVVREYFPETWIWDLYPVSESGEAEVPVKVPDTITEWSSSAFCTSPAGFGLSPAASLRVFSPFFVEPVLPYSVVRGEIFPLAVTLHNYMPSCLKIEVNLLQSEQFTVPAGNPGSYSRCVCPDRKAIFSFTVQPLALGSVNVSVRAQAVPSEDLCGNEVVIVPVTGAIDTVIRSVIVEPEGIPKDLAFSSLLCPKGSVTANGVFNLALPANVIPGSARAYLTIAGDIMGAALQNLDKLLTLPTGCGEQNMVKFAPNIFIQEYLQNSGQMTDGVREKAINFLKIGYQRQLTYKHSDDSYSAFGNNDPQGNTWLTAFVLKSFVRASRHIAVSPEHVSRPLGWLSEHQNVTTGCFISVGKLLNNAMKGGVADDVSLTAYVAAALLESNLTGPVVERALRCLRERVTSAGAGTYLVALSAYAFSLSSDSDTAAKLAGTLQSLAVTKGGLTHWSESNKKTDSSDEDDDDDDDLPPWSWRRYYRRSSTVSVETTAYALLSRLAQGSPDVVNENIGVVQWLSKQRNALGGFSSTQDTVVGLQALAAFAGLLHGGGDASTSSVKASVFDAAHAPVREVTLDSSNALVLHTVPLAVPTALPDSAATSTPHAAYSVEAAGSGCVLFQMSLKYSEPPLAAKPKFHLSVGTNPPDCSKQPQKLFTINVDVSYHGERGESNMALVEVNMVSGHTPIKASLKQLQSSLSLVKRFEVDAARAVIYLDKVDAVPVSLSFTVSQDIAINNLQPASVKIYDYYLTEDFAIAMYNAPCTRVE